MNVINGSRESYGDDMGAFLCFMAVRIIEMRRILRADGSIYLHCDPTASHYLKELMDAIFGHKNFRNEIIWAYDGPQRPSNRKFATKHDIILRYSRSNTYFGAVKAVVKLTEEEAKKSYKRTDDGRWYYDLPKGDYTEESMARLASEGRVRHTKNGTPRIMYFLDVDDEGNVVRQKQMHDVWTDIPSLGLVAQSKESTNFPTQKPLALYERIVNASSKEGDIVLDPFAGCATTPIAAERLGRHWIGMDIWDGAYDVVKQRMEDSRQLLKEPDPQIYYVTEPPERTDEGEEAAPFLPVKERSRPKHPVEAWQKLTHAQIREHLAEAQGQANGIICAGCGRVLEIEFTHLDHKQPRADGGDNWITNRILLCSPCNGKKSADLTLTGLRNRNKRDKWMRDENLARIAESKAKDKAEEVSRAG